MRKRLLRVAAVMLGYALAPSGLAQAAVTRFVSGTDPGCAGRSPCHGSIQSAVDAAQPGEAIWIQSGIYVEQVTISGKNNAAAATETGRIVIQADPTAAVGSVVLQGASAQCTSGAAIRVQQSRFVTIRGLTITGAAGQAISLVGGNNQNRAIHIERNRIFGNGSDGCNGGITIGQGNPDTVIVNNLIYGNGRNGIFSFDSTGGPHDIIGNTIHGNGWNGLSVGRSHQVLLANNAITGNGRSSGSTGGRFGVSREGSTGPNPAGIQLLNNLICGNRLGEIDGPSLDGSDSGNRTPTGAEGPGVNASPGCASSTAVYADVNGLDQGPFTRDDDFTPAAGSPLIDHGLDPRALGLPGLLNPLFEEDFSAVGARPRSGGSGSPRFDVGAIEWFAPGDTQPPTVSFVKPPANAFVRGSVAVRAEAVDTGGIASFTLRAGSQALTVALTPPPPSAAIVATATWETSGVADGAYALTASAADAAGNNQSRGQAVLVDNTPPDTHITSGPTGSVVGSSVTFGFTGSDNLTAVGNLSYAWRLDGGAYSAFSAASTAALSQLAPGSHTFEVKARDQAGNEDPTPAERTFSVIALGIAISDPGANATVAEGRLLVRGTVAGGGADVGVTVNGVVASVQAGVFAAVVPVTTPSATLTAVATSATGLTASHSVTTTVTAAAGDRMVLRANPPMGSAPAAVSFSLLGGPVPASIELDLDGDGRPDFVGPTLEGEVFTYGSPGLYVATARVTDALGNSTVERTVVEVVDPTGLDQLLQAKWSAIRNALTQGDLAHTLELFAISSREAYQDQLTALATAGALGVVAGDLGPIAMVQVLDGAAEYDLSAVQNATTYSFYILFVKDTDGVWRLGVL